jgi:hypothetical protein
MGELPNGYKSKDGELFPNLKNSISLLDLKNPTDRGHLIAG